MTTARDRSVDESFARSQEHFKSMVESVGVKRFAASMHLSTRQVNRILSGAQPNPVDRVLRALQSCDPETGDAVIEYLCQEAGGSFVRDGQTIDGAAVNAVRECAEAIAAISDGQVTEIDEHEVRQAIAALTALARLTQQSRVDGQPVSLKVQVRLEGTGMSGLRASRDGAHS